MSAFEISVSTIGLPSFPTSILDIPTFIPVLSPIDLYRLRNELYFSFVRATSGDMYIIFLPCKALGIPANSPSSVLPEEVEETTSRLVFLSSPD